MKEQIISYINVFKEGKDGKLYVSKNGKPFVRVSIKVEDPQYKDEYISGLWFGADCPWKVGESVEIIIREEEYQGKKQWKFELPKKENPNQKYFEEINDRLLKIEMMLIKIGQHLMPPPKEDYPPFEGEPNFDVGPATIDTSEPPF